MKALLKPYWILVFITLPQSILLWSLSRSYLVVKTQIPPEGVSLWLALISILSIAAILFTVYAITLLTIKKETSLYSQLFVLLFYIPLLYLSLTYEKELCPWNIPRWMLVSGEPLFMIYSLVMPAILFAIFNLATSSFKTNSNQQLFPSVIAMMMVPIGWYLIFTIVIPLIRDYSFYSMAPIHIGLIFMISGVVLFLFLVIKTVYGFVVRKNGTPLEATWVSFVFGLLLPIVGLTINATLVGNFEGGVFGDFSNPIFFILAGINGVILMIPKQQKKTEALLHFASKAALLPFSLYFFFVFLPYLPLSIIAIIVFGLGFLILSPLLITIIHINQLYSDYQTLTRHIAPVKLITILMSCFLIVPISITVNNLLDKKAIHEALDELYEKNPEELTPHVNIKRALHVIQNIKNNNQRSKNFAQTIPFIDQYYNWLVLDNLAISDVKLTQLEVLFNGNKIITTPPPFDRNENIKIDSFTHSTNFNSKLGQYQSNIKLFIRGDNSNMGMFATRFYFPKEYKLANYYLVVNGKREPGILAEKKTAEWIYRQITRVNKDPGLVRYTSFDSLQLNVFPFSPNELRETELEILHPHNLELNIDNKHISYNVNNSKIDQPIYGKKVLYIPGSLKESLPITTRKQYLHLLVDVSSQSSIKNIKQGINEVLKNEQPKYDSVAISLINNSIVHCKLNDYITELEKTKLHGAFRIGLGAKNILLQNYFKQTNYYPKFMVVSFNSPINTPSNWIFESGLEYLSPEPIRFYQRNNEGIFQTLDKYGNHINENQFFDDHVLVNKYNGKRIFLSKNSHDECFFEDAAVDLDEMTTNLEKINPLMAINALETYSSVFTQHASELWLKELKLAIANNILTNNTAFIVLENEAQKEVLRQKQKQVLSGKKSLDIEETEQMTEPSIIIFVLIGMALICFNWYKNRKYSS